MTSPSGVLTQTNRGSHANKPPQRDYQAGRRARQAGASEQAGASGSKRGTLPVRSAVEQRPAKGARADLVIWAYRKPSPAWLKKPSQIKGGKIGFSLYLKHLISVY